MTQKISKNMMGTLGTFTGGIVPSNSTVDTTVQLLINAVNTKEPSIPVGTSGQYLRGDKTLGVLSKTLVGLSNVDNTSDLNKPISNATQTALNGKESSLPSGGNNAHYLRGDKTWATLGRVSVGLSEVDNTSDINKPVSTAQAAAISALGLTLQPVNSNLTAISTLSTTTFGRSFLTLLDAPASRALLGLGTSVTYDVGTLGQRVPLLNGNNSWSGAQTFTSQIVSDSANATSIVLSRNNSSTNIAAEFKTTIGSIFIGNKNGSTFAVKSNNNFSTANWMEVTPTMTSVNGLSTANAQITGGSITGITDLAITDGGTGSSTVFGAKANLGLELVDNTSDLNKPISTATQSALDLKASVAAATTTVNGLMSFSDKVKLNGIATGATANATDALLRDRSTHTGTQSVDTIVESTAFKIMTAAERAKLSGIEAGATANSTDANLRDRSTHTGSQAISTIVNLQSTLDGKESIANRGVANGYAILGSDGKIPSINLPDNGSYKGNWNASTNTPTVVAGTGTNGDTYTVSVAGTQSVTGASTAFAIGDQLKFTTNGNKWERIPNYQSVSSVAGLTGPIVSSDLKTALVLTKTDVGLSNVDNTSDVNKPISTAVQTALNGKASTAVATTSVNGLLAFADKVKLDGIAAGATANATDSSLRDRATHTGSQAISTVTGLQAALDAKEATLASGTTAQYYRGDKSWQALNATAVGLGNVDNTADINKPVSTAQQAALNTKQATLVSGTSIKTVGGISLLGSGDVGTLGLEYGGTGSTTAAGARSSLGLGTAATVNTGTSGSVVPMLSSSLTTWSGNKTLSAIGAGVTTRAMVIDVDAGATAAYYFRTGGLDRWRIVKTNSAESGSDVGSDFSILRCADSGTSLGTVFSINRSTGATTISGALSVNSASSGVPVTISGTSGTTSLQRFLSGGSTRWDIGRSGDAETGSNAGSDFVIRRSDDSGNFIDNAFRINRSNARAYFTGILTAPGVFVSSANSTEGGRLTLAKPSTGTLASDVVVDINSDAIRFYEGGGSARGFHLKLDTAMAGAGSNIMDRAYHTGTQAISTVANLQASLDAITSKANAAQPNLLKNGGLEDGLNSGISSSSGFVLQPVGNWGPYVYCNITGLRVFTFNDITNLQPGVTYWIHVDPIAFGSSSVYCDMLFYDSNNNIILDSGQNPQTGPFNFSTNDTRRGLIAAQAACPEGAVKLTPRIIVNIVNGELAGFRRAKVECGPTWTPFTAESTLKSVFSYVKGRLGSQFATPLDYNGFDVTGATDMSSKYQTLINQASVANVPVEAHTCVIRLDQTIILPQNHIFKGMTAGSGKGVNPSLSSSFLIAHTGVGFTNTGGIGQGAIHIFDQSTRRIQPDVVTGQIWSPHDHNFDYKFDDVANLKMCRILTQNATRGIYCNGNRNTIEDWSGQCYKKGLQVDWSYDTLNVSRVHLWPFEHLQDEVMAYTQEYLTAFDLYRVDNPFFNNIFSIRHRYAFAIGWYAGDGGNKPAGTVSKLKLIGADLDIGDTAYWVKAAASGHTAKLIAVSTQGRDGTQTNQPMMSIEGPNTRMIGDFAFNSVGGNAVRMAASSAGSKISLLTNVKDWNTTGAGYPAIEVLSGGGLYKALDGSDFENGNGAAVSSGNVVIRT